MMAACMQDDEPVVEKRQENRLNDQRRRRSNNTGGPPIPTEWYICLVAGSHQNTQAITGLKHENPTIFSRVRNKATQNNRSDIVISANPLGTLQLMCSGNQNGGSVTDLANMSKNFACIMGPTSDKKVAFAIRTKWRTESRGMQPRTANASLLASEFGLPFATFWHVFYHLSLQDISIIEHLDDTKQYVEYLSYVLTSTTDDDC